MLEAGRGERTSKDETTIIRVRRDNDKKSSRMLQRVRDRAMRAAEQNDSDESGGVAGSCEQGAVWCVLLSLASRMEGRGWKRCESEAKGQPKAAPPTQPSQISAQRSKPASHSTPLNSHLPHLPLDSSPLSCPLTHPSSTLLQLTPSRPAPGCCSLQLSRILLSRRLYFLVSPYPAAYAAARLHRVQPLFSACCISFLPRSVLLRLRCPRCWCFVLGWLALRRPSERCWTAASHCAPPSRSRTRRRCQLSSAQLSHATTHSLTGPLPHRTR